MLLRFLVHVRDQALFFGMLTTTSFLHCLSCLPFSWCAHLLSVKLWDWVVLLSGFAKSRDLLEPPCCHIQAKSTSVLGHGERKRRDRHDDLLSWRWQLKGPGIRLFVKVLPTEFTDWSNLDSWLGCDEPPGPCRSVAEVQLA